MACVANARLFECATIGIMVNKRAVALVLALAKITTRY